MIEILILSLLGILAGTFTGLAPGIHINLIASFLVTILPKFQFISPISAISFIVSMSITHVFLDFIPSIYLGVPEEDTFLSILPGHEMLIQGKAQEALLYTFLGAFGGVIVSILISPIYLLLLPKFYPIIKQIIPYILIIVSVYLIFREERTISGIIVFFLSGFLGLISFNLPLNNPLLPLLTGLFGVSSLILSIKQKTSIPKQIPLILSKIQINKLESLKTLSLISLISPFFSFLPGLGSGHPALIASEIKETSQKQFLLLQGASSSIIMTLSFLALFAINKTRSGSAAAIQQILPAITLNIVMIILLISFITAIIAFFLGLFLSKYFSKIFIKINYQFLSIAIIFFLIIITFFFSGILGILILLTGTSIGLFTLYSNSRRANLMGSLILPVILYYLT
ncbi:MAG: tripartite tricarboxylate transporter permease [Nanoarchaeota archaeon]